MAGNPILAKVSDKFGANVIRMPVGFYGLGQTSDLMNLERMVLAIHAGGATCMGCAAGRYVRF